MKNATLLLLATAMLLPACSAAPRPEIKIAGALKAFQESSVAFTDARRKIVRQRQDNLSLMVERAARTRQEVERKQGTWRVLKDADRLDLFDNLMSEAKGGAESQEGLARIQAAHEQAARTAESQTERDRKKLASMIKDLYVLGADEAPGKQIQEYFQYMTAVAKQIAAKKPGGAP
jgi:hypothetical protein